MIGHDEVFCVARGIMALSKTTGHRRIPLPIILTALFEAHTSAGGCVGGPVCRHETRTGCPIVPQHLSSFVGKMPPNRSFNSLTSSPYTAA